MRGEQKSRPSDSGETTRSPVGRLIRIKEVRGPVLEPLLLILLLFLPGFALVKAAFPAKESLSPSHGGLYILLLSIVMSVSLAVLYSFLLIALGNTLPSGAPGYFSAPNLWAGMGVLTGALLVVAWWRGAFPFLRLLHPSLGRRAVAKPAVEGVSPAFHRLEALARERDRLVRSGGNPGDERLRGIEREMRALEAQLLDEAEA